jgi:hypothetical protein
VCDAFLFCSHADFSVAPFIISSAVEHIASHLENLIKNQCKMNARLMPAYRREVEELFGVLPNFELTEIQREAAVTANIRIFELSYNEWLFRLAKETPIWCKPGTEIAKDVDGHLLSGKSLDRRGELGELRFESTGKDGKKRKFKLAEVVVWWR